MTLERWIRELIANGQEVKFYKCKAWRLLRENILAKYHYECQECLKKGKYTRAHTVHHVNELKKRPDLALSEYYTDHEGKKCPNLLPLCLDCHNAEHDRIGYEPKNYLNEERW
jgi:5-methylcytosine-specific restriction endonuclease McrA